MDIKEHQAGSVLENTGRHPWEVARVSVIKRYLFRHVDTPIAVMDIGCGDAFVIEKLAEDFPGVPFYGVDTALDDKLIEEYSGRIRNPAVHLYRTTDELPPEAGHISAVLLLDVMEHIRDDSDFLRQIIKLPHISDATVWIITVPAFNSLFTIHDTWLGHFRRYTLRSLDKTLHHAGLVPIYTGYLFFSLFLARAIQKAYQKLKKPKESHMTGIGGWKPHPFLDPLIVFFLRADVALAHFLRIFGIRLPGLSCIAVCRKQ
jgi:hypothetical protein